MGIDHMLLGNDVGKVVEINFPSKSQAPELIVIINRRHIAPEFAARKATGEINQF
jgi:hypothetical protein